MAPLPGTDWIIVSGYNANSLYRVGRHTRAVADLAPSIAVRWNRKAYPNCPGPLGSTSLAAHGITIGARRLFVVNHGSREAIEVFNVRRRDAALTWVGCIPTPPDMMANSLVELASGTLVVTNLASPRPNIMADIVAGHVTGDVRLWSEKTGWRVLPNSQGSGPNGIALARDERSVYVAMSGSREIVEMSLDGMTPVRRSQPMSILPDNVRWTSEGTLLTTGMVYEPDSNARCFQQPECRPDYAVYEIAPATLAGTDLSGRFDKRSIPLPTTALRIDGQLWISSIRGDRIYAFPLKP